MRIENIWSNGETSLFGATPKLKTEDDLFSAPRSWGSDTVSFSPEVLAMQKSAASSGEENKDAGGEEKETAPVEEFKAYMEKKRSRAQGHEDLEELLEELKEKAAEISKKIEKVASDATIPEAEREAQLQALNNQLQQVQSQISDVEDEIFKLKMGKEEEKLADGLLKANGALKPGQTEREIMGRIGSVMGDDETKKSRNFGELLFVSTTEKAKL